MNLPILRDAIRLFNDLERLYFLVGECFFTVDLLALL